MKKHRRSAHRSRSAGVTLIELAITIALVGILAALIVQFVAPVRSYIDSSRRAALADTADTALRRIGRDVRLALPNSVRVGGANKFVEFLLVRTAGRYRLETDPGAGSTCTGGLAEDVLTFGSATESCFKTIGNLYNPRTDITTKVTANDYVVVFNLQPGTTNADAYQTAGTGGNKAKITAVSSVSAGEDKIEFENNTFNFESPGRRFFIIEGPVSYGCDTTVKTLTRYWGYTGFHTSQQTPPADGSSAILATGVTGCEFNYDSSVAAQGAGLLTMRLQLSMQDSRGDTENVVLYHTVHVNNVP